MADFDAIDALLAAVRQETPLPPAGERRSLREDLNLSRAQLAQALGVSPSTVGGWESGRDPGGEMRERYAYFLEGARTKLDATTAAAPASEATDDKPAEAEQTEDDTDVLAVAQPCVLCGQPARHQVEGFPQHLDPAECAPAPAGPVPAQAEKPAPRTAPRQSAPAGKPERAAGGVKVVPVGRRVQAASDTPDLIGSAVAAALAEHSGDVEAATAALIKRAIPDARALLDHTRKGGRYDVVAHPWLPDILRKQSARGADQVWEARPKWSRPELPSGEHEITALDINGAYLSALKTHLPLGQLEHTVGDHHDRRRAGLHLITPPAWDHGAYLPDPIGNRDEPGPLWVTEPTLRLLLRVSGPKYGLCDPPQIHESWTSGATEGLLEKFRIALKDARDRAIADGDEVTLEYVKAMYSKFVSTLGESNYNRELYRTDWMHLIRSQAFANLWWKAHRAYDEGLMVVRAMGTDELHVTGDWRTVFPEGRGVTEVKVKDVYTVGTDPSIANEPPESAS
ncbi:helix-turn-helix domain-containing protein [Streptomyces phaeochromogenes]|uniref:helix-turn-helix domain-containing protein n=1 Tax=Streptomyces phaeochromogenes TaxID=1923 RepID=UPI00386ACE36|nr:helix-turn-helix domain-containing protein [Streptomyces phaeochromogenes]WSS99681.1 helix-turn-helix domain-containing protein [Streptomyces phaeochromogenes]